MTTPRVGVLASVGAAGAFPRSSRLSAFHHQVDRVHRPLRALSGTHAALPIALALLQACTNGKNTAPDVPTVSIGPASPRTGDDLVAVVRAGSDDDGDAITYRYGWLQDGLPRDDLSTDTVPASETRKGEVWEVLVTLNDGTQDGEAGTASTTILNTPPEVAVALAPERFVTDDVVATVTSSDADATRSPAPTPGSWTAARCSPARAIPWPPAASPSTSGSRSNSAAWAG